MPSKRPGTAKSSSSAKGSRTPRASSAKASRRGAAASPKAKSAKPAQAKPRKGPGVSPKAQPAKASARAGAERSRHEASQRFAIDCARLLSGDKCRDIVVLDLRGRSPMTDIFVVATGSSDRQMRSAGEHVEQLGRRQGFSIYRDNLKEAHAKWILLDFVDVVVHLFEPETRLFYDIEMLWGDARRIEWEDAAEKSKRRAREHAEGDAAADSPANARNRAGLRAGEVID